MLRNSSNSEIKEMKDKSTVLSLDIVNRKHLNQRMLEKVLMNQRSTGKSISDEQRKVKFSDLILYGDSEEIYTFWDCLAGMKKGNSLLSQLRGGDKSKKERYENLLQRARGILKCFVLEIYKSIVDRFDSRDRDFRIKLTVGGFTYGYSSGDSSISNLQENEEENFVIELIKKYYEVSHNWNNGCEYDSVKYPLFKVDMGTIVRQYDNSFHDGVSYHLHYISRDIGRLFGHCSDHRDPGKSCKHGLRCRKEIHLTAKDSSGNIIYNIDDDIEYFKEVLTSIGKEIFRDELGVNATQNENPSLLEILKEEESVQEIKEQSENKKKIDGDKPAGLNNDGIDNINVSAVRNSRPTDLRNRNVSPRNVSQSPVSIGSWADAAKEGHRRAREDSITSAKSITISTSSYDIREWTLYWFGDPTKKDPDTDEFQPDGTNNVRKLMKELKLNPNDDRELNNVYKLIRRLFWRSKHNFSKGYNNNSIRLDYDYVKHQYVQYKAYADGTNFYNIDEISIKNATSEKHLGAEHKASNDDTARFHKDGRKNSYRHNNFGMSDYRPSPGHLVFKLSDYENINFRYLDVMAEFLNLPLPKDPIFLKPGGISMSDYDKSKAWNESELKWLDRDNLSLKGGYRDKIRQGNLVMEMLKDDNIQHEYKNFLKIVACSSSSLSPEYYIGNWLMKLDSKNFNCIMFYYENRANKAYEGINIRICIKQYIGYGYELEDLKNPTTMRLHLNGIDMLLANRLPDSFKDDMSNMGREEYINKISDVFINMAILKSLEEKNKSDLKGYLDSIQIVSEEDTNSQGEMENLEINYRMESKKYFENRLKFAYLSMMQDSTAKTDLFELVYSKVKEEIEKDKKEGWSIPCVTNAAKGDFYITPKVIQRVIESKLSIKTERDFSSEISSVENSIKANKKELGTLNSQLLNGNLSPQDRSSKEKDKKALEKKNDDLVEERKKIDDERNSNRRNYQLDIRNVDSKIKDLKNDSEKMKRDRNKILNIGDMDSDKLRHINSEIADNETSKIPQLLREREILIEKMRNVNQEASKEEWNRFCKTLEVVEESHHSNKVENMDNFLKRRNKFGGLV